MRNALLATAAALLLAGCWGPAGTYVYDAESNCAAAGDNVLKMLALKPIEAGAPELDLAGDGTFTLSFGGERQASGTWKLEEKTISFTADAGDLTVKTARVDAGRLVVTLLGLEVYLVRKP